jgi:Rps23 Pro-64 3,4-dihydroxylase Tpa1-like proline 4-hydroxylase
VNGYVTMYGALGQSLQTSVIDYSGFEDRVEEFKAQFNAATPWPHLVIDNFLQSEIATRAADAFPTPDKRKERLARFLGARSYGVRVEDQDPALGAIFEELQGARFTRFLARLSGIDDLAADRERIGAGLHQGARGSYLRIHADHNTHPQDGSRFRRINVLVYLNSRWESEWNGDLELWDRNATSCRKRVEPIFNRCAILPVDDTAYHGYGPLRVPIGVTRNALAEYYYSDVAAVGQTLEPHPTALPELEGEDALTSLSHRARRAILARVEKFASRKN